MAPSRSENFRADAGCERHEQGAPGETEDCAGRQSQDAGHRERHSRNRHIEREKRERGGQRIALVVEVDRRLLRLEILQAEILPQIERKKRGNQRRCHREQRDLACFHRFLSPPEQREPRPPAKPSMRITCSPSRVGLQQREHRAPAKPGTPGVSRGLAPRLPAARCSSIRGRRRRAPHPRPAGGRPGPWPSCYRAAPGIPPAPAAAAAPARARAA